MLKKGLSLGFKQAFFKGRQAAIAVFLCPYPIAECADKGHWIYLDSTSVKIGKRRGSPQALSYILVQRTESFLWRKPLRYYPSDLFIPYPLDLHVRAEKASTREDSLDLAYSHLAGFLEEMLNRCIPREGKRRHIGFTEVSHKINRHKKLLPRRVSEASSELLEKDRERLCRSQKKHMGHIRYVEAFVKDVHRAYYLQRV